MKQNTKKKTKQQKQKQNKTKRDKTQCDSKKKKVNEDSFLHRASVHQEIIHQKEKSFIVSFFSCYAFERLQFLRKISPQYYSLHPSYQPLQLLLLSQQK